VADATVGVNRLQAEDGMRPKARRSRTSYRGAVVAGAAIGMLLPIAAHCQDDAARFAALFDRPALVKTVPPKSAADPTGAIICTNYPDLMVRETGTDTPDPNTATLVALPAGTARPPCDARQRPHAITLQTEGFGLLGRKGPFLLFSATDPNGAIPFMTIDARSGRVIFTDGTAADRSFQAVTVQNGVLHLRYTRGFNASCSIMQSAATCWSKLLTEGKIPHDMGQPVPSPELCAASYAAERAPADDPSIITYDVEMTIDLAGNAQTLSRGAVGCAPVP